jgi:hypothetical protein
VLSWDCRRFRARFEPGSGHPHRRRCPECRAFAEAVERAAGLRLPLPESLREELRAVRPLPQIPAPGALRSRLQGIARPGDLTPAPLPGWLLSPRYAVAASALLATLLTAALGDPVGPGLRIAASLTGAIEEEGIESLATLGGAARERYDEARRSVAASVESASAGLEEITDKSRELIPFREPEPSEPEGEPSGSERRRDESR